MARPYSYDLRQKAVEAVLNGAKLVEVSELFGMSRRPLQRWLKMWSESGDYRPKQNYQKGHSAKITDLEEFRQFVEANQSRVDAKRNGSHSRGKSYNRWSSP